jgi:hypothetical protein
MDSHILKFIQAPRACDQYALDIPVSAVRAKIRENFRKNANVCVFGRTAPCMIMEPEKLAMLASSRCSCPMLPNRLLKRGHDFAGDRYEGH